MSEAATRPAPRSPVLVLGGSGFLGRRVSEALLSEGRDVRVGVRKVERARALFGERVEVVGADVRDARTVAAAMAGASAAVNAVSLYVETADASFHDIHVAGAGRVAAEARRNGIRLVHLSGIGADPHAGNAYVRARGRGEEEVRQAHPDAIVLRSAAMVGEGDALLARIADLVNRMPVIPLFGNGGTRMQPVHVEDVAAAVVALLEAGTPLLSEIGGPRTLTYRELVEEVADACGRSPIFVPMPFLAWRGLANAGRLLPSAPIDPGQVALMARDTVAAPDLDLRTVVPLPARNFDTVLRSLCG